MQTFQLAWQSVCFTLKQSNSPELLRTFRRYVPSSRTCWNVSNGSAGRLMVSEEMRDAEQLARNTTAVRYDVTNTTRLDAVRDVELWAKKKRWTRAPFVYVYVNKNICKCKFTVRSPARVCIGLLSYENLFTCLGYAINQHTFIIVLAKFNKNLFLYTGFCTPTSHISAIGHMGWQYRFGA